jgi:hypothetical protein
MIDVSARNKSSSIFTDAEPESDELAKSVWLLVSLLQLVLEWASVLARP